MKKIAIATDNGQVSAHFGRCGSYTIFEVDETKNEFVCQNQVDTPGHQPGMLPRFLNEKGVSIVIAGGMGHRAQTLFKEFDIEPIIGISGKVQDVIQCYLKGELESGESLCNRGSDHGHGDGCHHDE